MLSLQRKEPSKIPKTSPNIIPCSIKHSGPIRTSSRYWSPRPSPARTGNGTTKPKTSTVYFRGRKLLGRHVVIPPTHHGVLLQKTRTTLPSSTKRADGGTAAEQLMRMDEAVDDGLEEGGLDEEPIEVKTVEQKARFDQVVVWAHEALPEGGDGFVKAIEEWMGFAQAMHYCND